MTVVEPQTLKVGKLARDAIELADSTDLSEIAEQTFSTVPEVLRDELALWGWRETLRKAVRDQRRPRPMTGFSAGQEAVRAAHQSGLLERWYSVGEDFKPLGECSVENVYRIGKDYQDRAEENAREAEKFDRLHKAMKRAKAETVSDLGEEKVERIFNA